MSKREDVAKLVRVIGLMLEGAGSTVHGAVLAELTALWIVSRVANDPAQTNAAHMRLLETQTEYARLMIYTLAQPP